MRESTKRRNLPYNTGVLNQSMKLYNPFQSLQSIYRPWLMVTILLLALLVLLYQPEAMAAPPNQTVPQPTPTREDTPVPTATPVPDRNDDDDDDDNNNNNNPLDPLPVATLIQDERDLGDPQPEPTATATPEVVLPDGISATVAVLRLNVRSGPGTNFDVLGVVTNGQALSVLGSNEIGDWWQVCCLPGTDTVGWVASQFVEANFDVGQDSSSIPQADTLPTPPEPTVAPTIDPAATPAEPLRLQIQQDPVYTWQGEEVVLVYLIANTTDTAAANLELRNELPLQLQFVGFDDLGGGTAITETTPLSNTIFAITWPEIPADGNATARVRVQVAEEIPDGSIIDNLAVVAADDLPAVTAAIGIGMPPLTIPDFR